MYWYNLYCFLNFNLVLWEKGCDVTLIKTFVSSSKKYIRKNNLVKKSKIFYITIFPEKYILITFFKLFINEL